jgi:hypothetical protein
MYRIKKYPRGWVVEVKKRKWWGKSYWVHFISVAGIDSMPWHHTTFDYAMMSLIDKVKQETLENSDSLNV